MKYPGSRALGRNPPGILPDNASIHRTHVGGMSISDGFIVPWVHGSPWFSGDFGEGFFGLQGESKKPGS